MRLYLTAPGVEWAFVVTKMRPRRVPTHIVPLSLGARSMATMYPVPLVAAVPAVRSGLIVFQSPHGEGRWR
jgi:hypothetical protein